MTIETLLNRATTETQKQIITGVTNNWFLFSWAFRNGLITRNEYNQAVGK
jgi:hypothetical protein